MFNLFLVKTTRLPVGVHKKIQPNRSSRLAGYTQHVYECLVLLYRFWTLRAIVDSMYI